MKGTITYEFEMFATALATDLWHKGDEQDLRVHFRDNDGFRSSMTRAGASGTVGQRMMFHFFFWKGNNSSRTWSARVPAETNAGDFSLYLRPHVLPAGSRQGSVEVAEKNQKIWQYVKIVRDTRC